MNALKDRFHRRRGRSVVAKDSKGLFRPEHLSRRDVAPETAGATQVLRVGEVRFTSPQVLLSALALVDICHQAVPADNAAFGITLRKPSHLAPSVHAIGSTAAMLELERLSRFDRAPPGVAHARNVIRMAGVVGGPILQFLERLAEIVQGL